MWLHIILGHLIVIVVGIGLVLLFSFLMDKIDKRVKNEEE